MFFEEEMIYSKRYPQPEKDLEQFSADIVPPITTPEQAEISYQKFISRLNDEKHLEAIPGQEEKAEKFIALAKKFSEDYEIDIDISRSSCAVDVSLHFYCSAWPKDMTRQFAQLFNMCDNLYSYILKSEPSDFTLILKLNTHIVYLTSMAIDEF